MGRWLRLRVPAGAEAEAASAAFFLAGFDGVAVEEDGTVVGYAPAAEGPGRAAALRRCLAAVGVPAVVEAAEVDDGDWADAWRRYWRPQPLAPTLWVVPSWWEPFRPPEGAVVLHLDPGMAFGTGDHASTRLALVLLAEALRRRPGARVLDAGTGSGILAVAAARLGAEEVLAVDVDPEAVRAAAENAARNGVADRVRVLQEEAGALATRLEPGSCDVVVANILAEVLVPLAPAFARVLAPGGEAVLSGVVAERRREVERAYEEAGLHPLASLRLEGWCALRRVRGRAAA